MAGRPRSNFEERFKAIEVEELLYRIQPGPVAQMYSQYISIVRKIATFNESDTFLLELKRRIIQAPYDLLFSIVAYGQKTSRESFMQDEDCKMILETNGKILKCRQMTRRGELCSEMLTVWDKSFMCQLCNAGPFHEQCARLHICDYRILSSGIIEHADSQLENSSGIADSHLESSRNDAGAYDNLDFCAINLDHYEDEQEVHEENSHLELNDCFQTEESTSEAQYEEIKEDSPGSMDDEKQEEKIQRKKLKKKKSHSKLTKEKLQKKKRKSIYTVKDGEVEDDQDNDPDYKSNSKRRKKVH